MKIAPLDTVAIQQVVTHMSETSRNEAFATLPVDYPFLIERLNAALPLMFGAFAMYTDDDVPTTLVTLLPAGGGRSTIIWIATDRFPEIMIAAHRWWRRIYVPEFFMQFRRIDFTGSSPDTPSGRWLKSVGFMCEGIARHYTNAGGDLAYWAWINPAWLSAREVSDVA